MKEKDLNAQLNVLNHPATEKIAELFAENPKLNPKLNSDDDVLRGNFAKGELRDEVAQEETADLYAHQELIKKEMEKRKRQVNEVWVDEYAHFKQEAKRDWVADANAEAEGYAEMVGEENLKKFVEAHERKLDPKYTSEEIQELSFSEETPEEFRDDINTIGQGLKEELATEFQKQEQPELLAKATKAPTKEERDRFNLNGKSPRDFA